MGDLCGERSGRSDAVEVNATIAAPETGSFKPGGAKPIRAIASSTFAVCCNPRSQESLSLSQSLGMTLSQALSISIVFFTL